MSIPFPCVQHYVTSDFHVICLCKQHPAVHLGDSFSLKPMICGWLCVVQCAFLSSICQRTFAKKYSGKRSTAHQTPIRNLDLWQLSMIGCSGTIVIKLFYKQLKHNKFMFFITSTPLLHHFSFVFLHESEGDVHDRMRRWSDYW